ncbi:MAG: dihydroorotase [Alphaproteobacteria bacterium]|nr:dihydroorotase [Alphaproteobacteria bacterium]
MTKRTTLVNARLLDPASRLDMPGGILIEDGRITAIGPSVTAGGVQVDAAVIDCGGACAAPGLVDMRVQLGEPGGEHKETIDSGSLAAAAGGVTAVVALPNTSPIIDDVHVVEFIARRAREVRRVKVFAYGALTRGLKGEQLTEIGTLKNAGALAFTDGLRAVSSARVMRRALSYAQTFDALIVQHPEEPELARDGVMTEGEIATRLGLPGIPAAAEAMMIDRDLRLVALTGGRYHAAHVTTAEGVALIRRAKREGWHVTCDTAPHYFALNETSIGEYRTFGKVSPPLRTEADRRAVVDALADGTIDAVASDHDPQDQESKRLPFGDAEPGIVGLESLLPLCLELYHNGHMPLLDVLEKLTSAPADLLGLPLGRLAPGRAGDVVVFDPDSPTRILVDAFRSKSKNSPFDRRPVQGRVLRTIVDGRTVFEAG